MGTNYYHITQVGNVCEHCGKGEREERRHIGKSSGGWCFALRVYPEDGITGLNDWKKEWAKGGEIVDEYGDDFNAETMRLIIAERHGRVCNERDWDLMGYTDEADFHAKNHSGRGPNNLPRHKRDRFCVGHGEGTWDLVVGEFS
jgi:hypothetical protein